MHDPTIISFDALPTYDGQTDRQTNTPPMAKSRHSIAERDKKPRIVANVWGGGLLMPTWNCLA